jgi:hypothetical protein
VIRMGRDARMLGSTVLRLQEFAPSIGMVRSGALFLRQRSSPSGPRAGLPSGRGSGVWPRAIERSPRPFGEEPPTRWPIFNGAFGALAWLASEVRAWMAALRK